MHTPEEIDQEIVKYLRGLRPDRNTAVKVISEWFQYLFKKYGGAICNVSVAPHKSDEDAFVVSYDSLTTKMNYQKTYDVKNPKTEDELKGNNVIEAYDRAMKGI